MHHALGKKGPVGVVAGARTVLEAGKKWSVQRPSVFLPFGGGYWLQRPFTSGQCPCV